MAPKRLITTQAIQLICSVGISDERGYQKIHRFVIESPANVGPS